MSDSYTRREVRAAVGGQRARSIALLESLEGAAWDTQVLPGWRVREVVAHLISTDEAALTGRLAGMGLSAVDVPTLEAWNERQVLRWSGRPIPALLYGLDRWGKRLERIARVTPEVVARRRLPTPMGNVSLLWLGMLRVYDEWIHMEDIRRALSLPSDADAGSVRPVARHLFEVIPWQTLPRIPAPAVGSIELAYRDLDLPRFGVDLEARRYGIDLRGGSVIEARAAALIMAAAGRDRWRDLETAGDLEIRGDRGPAEVFLDALLAV